VSCTSGRAAARAFFVSSNFLCDLASFAALALSDRPSLLPGFPAWLVPPVLGEVNFGPELVPLSLSLLPDEDGAVNFGPPEEGGLVLGAEAAGFDEDGAVNFGPLLELLLGLLLPGLLLWASLFAASSPARSSTAAIVSPLNTLIMRLLSTWVRLE
jgi:hypothetical protein